MVTVTGPGPDGRPCPADVRARERGASRGAAGCAPGACVALRPACGHVRVRRRDAGDSGAWLGGLEPEPGPGPGPGPAY
jgi:hypothetical protein